MCYTFQSHTILLPILEGIENDANVTDESTEDQKVWGTCSPEIENKKSLETQGLAQCQPPSKEEETQWIDKMNAEIEDLYLLSQFWKACFKEFEVYGPFLFPLGVPGAFLLDIHSPLCLFQQLGSFLTFSAAAGEKVQWWDGPWDFVKIVDLEILFFVYVEGGGF